MRFLGSTLVRLCFASLAVMAGVSAQDGSPPEGSSSADGGDYKVKDCNNGGSVMWCKKCVEGQWVVSNTCAYNLSLVSNLNKGYLHDAHDYRIATDGSGGCAPCGSATAGLPANGLRHLMVTRYHRSRPGGYNGSFGSSVYAPWDLQTTLEWTIDATTGLPGAVTVRLFDPADLNIKLAFTEKANGETAIDGILRDPAGIYRRVELLDAAGQPTPLGASAAQVRLVAHDGMAWTFEVVNVNNGATTRQGRLISQVDRYGQVQQGVTYRFPATATLADLGNDRQRWWQVATVSDAYGRSAVITYDNVTKRGARYAITRIDLPTGGSLQYAYSGANLSTVTHPGGEVSTIAVSFDTALQKTRWVFDDPAAEPGHQRKTVWFSGSSWKDPVTGVVSGQTVGLTARVDNAAGEVLYYNQPDYTDSNIFYFWTAGQGYYRLRASNSVFVAPTEIARATANGFVADPATLTWEPVLNYGYTGTELLASGGDALGRATTYTTSQQTRTVTKTVHPDGTVSTSTYNAFSQPLVETDRLGRVTTSTYDTQGNRLSRTVGSGADAATTTWEYNQRGQVTAEIDANGRRTDYAYDALGQLSAITAPSDDGTAPRATRTFAYDAAGRLERAVDAGGRAVVFAYDGRNRVIRRTYGDASVERIEYAQGLIQSEFDRNGVETRYGYDAAGRRISTTVAAGRPEAVSETCAWLYGSATQKASCVQAGERTDYGYDSRYRLVSTTRYPRAGAALTEWRGYDVLDRLVATTDAYGRGTGHVYDVDDRIVRTVRELVAGGVPAVDAAFAAERAAARSAWQLAGYGGMAAPGSASVAGDVLTLTATAYGTNSTADAGALYSRQLTGDGSVTVRLDEVPTAATAMYGIMLRGGLAGTAPMLSVYVNPQNGSVGVRHRAAAGQGTIHRALFSGALPLALPRWLRIERTGRMLRAGTSLDGVTWTWATAVAVQLPSTVEAGSFLNVLSGATWPVVVRGTVPVLGDAAWLGQSAAMRGEYYQRHLSSLPRIATANPPYVIEDSTYDAAGQVTARIDARGVRTAYAYDSQGRLVTQTEAADTMPATTVFAYDAVGNRTSVTSPRGIVTRMTYTGRNLLATVSEAFGTPEATLVRRLTYSPTGKIASETDALDRVTSYHYGVCCDRLVRIVDPAGFATMFAYDFVGNRTSVTDANGLTTLTAYDARHRVRSVTNAAGETVQMGYDDNLADGVGIDAVPAVAAILPGLGLGLGADGAAVASTDATGAIGYELRDGLGRPVARIDALGQVTRVVHDAVVAGLVETSQIDALGHSTRSRADGAGRVRQQIDALDHASTAFYDPAGNQLTQRDALGLGWDAIYDARSRLLARTTTRQDQAVSTSWSYDLDGNRLAETDAAGQTETSSYDRRNRRITLTDRLGGITRFGYDAVGNLVSISDADNEGAQGGAQADRTTQYAYDARNLLIAEAFPSGQQGRTLRVYTYDGGRRLTGRQVGILSGAFGPTPVFAGSAIATSYAYDAANRLTTRGYADGLSDAFAYDAAGRLTSASSARYATAVARVYDAAGRLSSEALTLPDGQVVGNTLVPATYAVGYAYHADNTLASQTYPTGAVVTRTYTTRHELASVALDGSGVHSRTYDASGRRHTSTAGNGLVETRGYVPGDHLVASIAVPAVMGFGYIYDAVGRKLSESQTVGGSGQTFGYDAAGRLTAWQAGTATQSWDLSLVGDWRATTRNGVVEPRVNTAVHEAVQVGPNILTYDVQGNLTRDEHQTALAWDAENRLVRARVTPDASVSGLGSIASYRYDALGRRIAKTVDGVTTLYLPAGAQTVVELTRPALPASQAAIDGAEADGTLDNMAQTPASGGILPGGGISRVNFQPATTVVPAGFVKDAGRISAVRTNALTYGWSSDATDQAVVRHGAVPLVEYDTHIRLEAGQSWRVALPNGTYPVVVVAGDALSTLQTNHLLLNGQRLTDPDPSSPPAYAAGDFDGWARQVTVSDGYLTIAGDTDAVDAKLCFVEIGLAGSTLPAGIETTLQDVMTRMTNQTGANPQPVEQVREFVYGSYVDEVLCYQQTVGGIVARYYPHYNHLYSVAALTDSTGVVVERYTYDAYGRQTITSAGGVSRSKSAVGYDRGFTGYIADQETGLLHARARQYSPTLGRFVGRDALWRSDTISTWPHEQALNVLLQNYGNPMYGGYISGFSLYKIYGIPNTTDPHGYAPCNAADQATADATCRAQAVALGMALPGGPFGHIKATHCTSWDLFWCYHQISFQCESTCSLNLGTPDGAGGWDCEYKCGPKILPQKIKSKGPCSNPAQIAWK